LQTITFCIEGAHHQNGLVEREIKDLTLTNAHSFATRQDTLARDDHGHVVADGAEGGLSWFEFG